MSLQSAFDRLNETRTVQAAAAASAVQQKVANIAARKEERFRAAFNTSVARVATHIEKDLTAIIAQKRTSLFVPRPTILGGPEINRDLVSYTLFKSRASKLPENFVALLDTDPSLVAPLAEICAQDKINATVQATWNYRNLFGKDPVIELVAVVEPKTQAETSAEFVTSTPAVTVAEPVKPAVVTPFMPASL